MNLKSQPESGVNGALWLIAFSLFTIAICMVFLVIDKKFGPPRDEARLEASRENAVVQARPERFRVGAPEPVRRGDTFADLVSPAGEEARVAASAAVVPAGFLPTRMEPAPGSYLPALPRIVGQANYRTVVKGRVTLKGTPPAERESPVPENYPCERPDPPVLKTRFFLVGTNGGLANTVVYFSRNDAIEPLQFSRVTNELVFTDCRLEPAFSVVPGQRWNVRDVLGLAHAIEGFGSNRQQTVEIPAGGNVSFPPRNQSDTPVTVTCKLHPWETAQIWFATPSSLFTITDGNGEFSVTNVPPGEYELVATHWSGRLAQKTTKKLTVKSGQAVSADLTILAPSAETARAF